MCRSGQQCTDVAESAMKEIAGGNMTGLPKGPDDAAKQQCC